MKTYKWEPLSGTPVEFRISEDAGTVEVKRPDETGGDEWVAPEDQTFWYELTTDPFVTEIT